MDQMLLLSCFCFMIKTIESLIKTFLYKVRSIKIICFLVRGQVENKYNTWENTVISAPAAFDGQLSDP